MMTVALVNDWIVAEIVNIDESQYQQYAVNCQVAIDVTSQSPQPEVGWSFDGANLNPPANYAPSMKITKLAFRERFQMSELVAILTAAATNPVLAVMQENISVATYVDLNRSDTQAGVEYLVSLGILTQARATAILTTTPAPAELYQG